MENKISIEELFRNIGIDPLSVQEQAESLDLELTDEDMYRIGNALFDDEALADARWEAISRAIEFNEHSRKQS